MPLTSTLSRSTSSSDSYVMSASASASLEADLSSDGALSVSSVGVPRHLAIVHGWSGPLIILNVICVVSQACVLRHQVALRSFVANPLGLAALLCSNVGDHVSPLSEQLKSPFDLH